MKLYMIRHGESEANKSKCFAGQADVKLTSKGIEDALHARDIISHLKFDKVYSSDLSRAIDTQKIALPNATAVQTSLIREIHVGNLAGKPLSECLAEYGSKLNDDRMKFNFLPYGGENIDMLHSRIRSFLSTIQVDNFENIAAFCHGGVINAMLEIVLNTDIDKVSICCDNCSVNVFEYKNNKWSLCLWNYLGIIT